MRCLAFQALTGRFFEAERADKVDDRNDAGGHGVDAGGHDDVEHAADQRDHAQHDGGGRLGAVAGRTQAEHAAEDIGQTGQHEQDNAERGEAFGRGRRKHAAGDNAQHEHQSAADQLQHGNDLHRSFHESSSYIDKTNSHTCAARFGAAAYSTTNLHRVNGMAGIF